MAAEGRMIEGVRRHALGARPTLDSIAAEPRTANLLSAEEAREMVPVCAAVLEALRERATRQVLPQAADRLLDAEDMAALLGVSKSWIEKHVRDLPPRVSVKGIPRWRLSDVQEWLRSLPTYAAAA